MIRKPVLHLIMIVHKLIGKFSILELHKRSITPPFMTIKYHKLPASNKKKKKKKITSTISPFMTSNNKFYMSTSTHHVLAIRYVNRTFKTTRASHYQCSIAHSSTLTDKNSDELNPCDQRFATSQVQMSKH